jgi:uncharacterized protein (TIGR02246 family)
VNVEEVQAWIDAYVRAWESNDATQVGELFAADARYYTHPFRDPWEGRDTIVRNWTEHADPPGSWRSDYRAIAVHGDTGVVRGHTVYLGEDGTIEQEYANIFVIAFDGEGRATEFTEFFVASKPPPRG